MWSDVEIVFHMMNALRREIPDVDLDGKLASHFAFVERIEKRDTAPEKP